MISGCTREQEEAKASFRAFVESEVVPQAGSCDEQQTTPPQLIQRVADAGYWGASIPQAFGGREMDMLTSGLLCAEFARGSVSLGNMLTVQAMVANAIETWGSNDQADYWLPRMASGQVLGAFALTEPEVGSDARNVKTTAVAAGGGYVLDGVKRWITSGQVAKVVIVIAQCEGRPTAFLLPGDSPGLTRKPITNMLGARSSMLAELHLDNCHVPKAAVLGRVGLGFSHVATAAFDQGRHCVAWECVGGAEACLEASLTYARTRSQFGSALSEYQLVQEMIAEMAVGVRAATLLCLQATRLREARDSAAKLELCVAKYFASKVFSSAAASAVQIHGANGCGNEYAVQRYYRDSKIMEILEGSSQIQQVLIARQIFHDHEARAAGGGA
jgi:glutaryl-CoA dehydrogenase (non-decarboxylating)